MLPGHAFELGLGIPVMDPRFITGQYAWLKYRQILLVQEQQLLQTIMTLNSILLHEVSCDPTEKCLCHGQILMPGVGNTSKLCLEFSLDFFVLLSSVFENRPLHTGQFVLEGHLRGPHGHSWTPYSIEQCYRGRGSVGLHSNHAFMDLLCVFTSLCKAI